MTNGIIKGQSNPARGRVRELVSKYSIEDPDQVNVKRERFLSMLKVRYGYTNEKAVVELERLLRQFYSMNKSLGLHHNRPFLRHPQAE
jgi:hypothetical protein